MKCPVNADCDHEKRLQDLCGNMKTRPPRLELYSVIATVCVFACICIAYLWIGVSASAKDIDVTESIKQANESIHRQEIMVTRMEGVVNNLAISLANEASRSKMADREHDECDKDTDKRIDSLEKR